MGKDAFKKSPGLRRRPISSGGTSQRRRRPAPQGPPGASGAAAAGEGPHGRCPAVRTGGGTRRRRPRPARESAEAARDPEPARGAATRGTGARGMRASHLLRRPLPPRAPAPRRLAARQRTKAPARPARRPVTGTRPPPPAPGPAPPPKPSPARLSNCRVATSGSRAAVSSSGARRRGAGRGGTETSRQRWQRGSPAAPPLPRRPARPRVPHRPGPSPPERGAHPAAQPTRAAQVSRPALSAHTHLSGQRPAPSPAPRPSQRGGAVASGSPLTHAATGSCRRLLLRGHRGGAGVTVAIASPSGRARSRPLGAGRQPGRSFRYQTAGGGQWRGAAPPLLGPPRPIFPWGPEVTAARRRGAPGPAPGIGRTSGRRRPVLRGWQRGGLSCLARPGEPPAGVPSWAGSRSPARKPHLGGTQQDSPAPAASQPRLVTGSFILPLVRHSRTALPTRGREHHKRPAGQGTRALHRVLRLHSPRRLAATEPPVLTLERAHQRAALP